MIRLCDACHRAEHGFGNIASGHYTIDYTPCDACSRLALCCPCDPTEHSQPVIRTEAAA